MASALSGRDSMRDSARVSSCLTAGTPEHETMHRKVTVIAIKFFI
ncbi:MAG: hypothetical protein ACI3Y6_08795 [Candidatus Cryptobacteroides sp.]